MTVPPPSSIPTTRPPSDRSYRQAKALPEEVLDSCSIWLEEQLYSQAFSLLTSTLTSATGTHLPAFVAPPQCLALAATLVVHPLLTTRTTSPDKHAGADDAVRFLLDVFALLGAQEGGLTRAFRFLDEPGGSRGKRARARDVDVHGDDDHAADQPGRLTSPYVGKESLWSSAEDFWAAVGWAFNCSVAHRGRWERWKLWLAFMLDVLQDDLETRLPEAEKVYSATQSAAAVGALLDDCLLTRFLLSLGEGRNGKRRLMRAVLADGGVKSMGEFGEVWKGETKGPKGRDVEKGVKRRKLDVENGEYGDYDVDSADELSRASSVSRSRSATAGIPSAQTSRAASRAAPGDEEEDSCSDHDPNPTTASTINSLGGQISLHLRQRILALLLLYSTKKPTAFLDPEDLFDLYTEFLRPLPLPIFTSFVLPPAPWLGPNSQASLNQMLLRPLLAAAAPAYHENSLTQKEFQLYYAPFAANNSAVVDNAKVSILVEGLLRLLWRAGHLVVDEKLRVVVEKGIRAREEKIGAGDGRRKVRKEEEEEARKVMVLSAGRMRAVLDVVESGEE